MSVRVAAKCRTCSMPRTLRRSERYANLAPKAKDLLDAEDIAALRSAMLT